MLIDLGGRFHGSMQHVQITAHPLVYSRLIVAIKTGGRFSGKVHVHVRLQGHNIKTMSSFVIIVIF